jgi:SAM-dependent methyltransferase
VIRTIADFGELPFLFRILDTPGNPPGIPDRVRFLLGIDEATGRLVQVPSEELPGLLRRAYLHGSMITGMMAEDGIGREYAEDFLALLAESAGVPVQGARILELGCGNGYLLSRLALLGAQSVVGIEPGPQAEDARSRYGVEVLRGFFPEVSPAGPFDLIISYCLLEHLEDPVTHLRDAGRLLAPGGRMAVMVQNEGPYIRSGEFSLLFHEHFSYFSEGTLRRTLQSAGGTSAEIARSRFSNLLFGCSAWDKAGGAVSAGDPADDLAAAAAFTEKARRLALIWKERVSSAAGRPGGAALYVAARAANYFSFAGMDPGRGVRLFDDNPSLHGTYLPGIPLPIRAGEDLAHEPAAEIVVMSLSFGEKIAGLLRERWGPRTQVLTLQQLAESAG